MTITFRGGRRHAQPARPALRATHYRTTKTPPPSADWLSKVTDWGMCLNDRIGDCTCAGAAHKILGDTTYGQGTAFRIPDSTVLKTYETVSGYRPSDPDSDRGALCQDVLAYWRRHGIDGHKILAYARVDISDLDEVRWAIATFGQVYAGFNFPSSAETQFNQGQPWTVVPGATIEGGHCVTLGGYDTGSFTCVTWGAPQRLTVEFFQRYFDEVWVIIDADFVNRTTGRDASGVDLAQLGVDFAALTGEPDPIKGAAA